MPILKDTLIAGIKNDSPYNRCVALAGYCETSFFLFDDMLKYFFEKIMGLRRKAVSFPDLEAISKSIDKDY